MGKILENREYLYRMRHIIKKILREESLREGHIKIPQSEILKSGVLLDMINSNIDNYKSTFNTYNTPIVEFMDFFKLKDNDGNDVMISVGIYNDENDGALGRMDTINNLLLINVSKFNKDNPIELSDFENMITHELVHSIDPLVRNKDVFSKYYDKKGSDLTDTTFDSSKSINTKSEYERSYDKYRKSQHEYKAELTPLINILDRYVKGNENKIKWVLWLVSMVGYYDNADELYFETESYFESDGESKIRFNDDEYWKFIFNLFNVVKPLSNKPSLMKKLNKELYSGLSY